jgi:hypothetical protein
MKDSLPQPPTAFRRVAEAAFALANLLDVEVHPHFVVSPD